MIVKVAGAIATNSLFKAFHEQVRERSLITHITQLKCLTKRQQ